tara:strand:+ start:752 stop:1651 length:900 start_codon:yes stop_codon:yes gene_type:complete
MLECHLHRPEIIFDWVVEKPFAELPQLLPNVKKIITTDVRQWRKKPFQATTRKAFKSSLRELREHSYDLTIDAQGLIRTAFLGYLSRPNIFYGHGKKTMLHDAYRMKESPGRYFYHHVVNVPERHLPSQFRKFIGSILQYPFDLNKSYFLTPSKRYKDSKTILLFPNTSCVKKTWGRWNELTKELNLKGFKVCVINGSEKEYLNNQKKIPEARNLPPTSIMDVKQLIEASKLCIGVDTGLTHLACILKHPCVSLYRENVNTPDVGAIYHENNKIIHQDLASLEVGRVYDAVLPLLDSVK